MVLIRDLEFLESTVISACISKYAFMKAPDESGINKDFTEKSTDWIATAGKRCTDVAWRWSSQNKTVSKNGNCYLSFVEMVWKR